MVAKIIPVAVFDFVVFGATGDLTLRKLVPALYWRFRDGQMPEPSRVIGAARSDLDDEAFRQRAASALEEYVEPDALASSTVQRFLSRLSYCRLDAAKPDGGWPRLEAALDPERVRVFYLATAPDLYGPICRNIAAAGLASPASRVVLEKPIGHDLASAREINDQVGEVFAEKQTFRIDHYLGKETVQNLLALRFANSIFERLWNTDVIDHVQITVAETVGLEGRGELLRSRRRAARHGAEPPVAVAVPDGDGAAGLARCRPGARREAESAARAAADAAARGGRADGARAIRVRCDRRPTGAGLSGRSR